MFFDPFDLNKDGKLDLAEGFLKYQMIMGEDEEEEEIMEEEEVEEEEDREAQLESELELFGLDRTDLEFMDEDERREAIEDAGLDPDDYDELFD